VQHVVPAQAIWAAPPLIFLPPIDELPLVDLFQPFEVSVSSQDNPHGKVSADSRSQRK